MCSCYYGDEMDAFHEIPQILSDLWSQFDDGLQLLIAKAYWYRLFDTRFYNNNGQLVEVEAG